MAKHHILFVAMIVLVQRPLASAEAPTRKMKVFILAGQSNMVGWGNSTKLPNDLRDGNDRVLMFENSKWRPLKPFKRASRKQQKFGMKEFSFGPEIAFAREMAQAWPKETIGIVKFSIGGTSILTWKPDWSKKDADRVRQGRLGSLYKKLMTKVKQAGKNRELEIVGFLWLQGGGDMKKVDVAKEYLDNLKSLVAAVRKDTGVSDLPFLFGSSRNRGIPDDLSKLVPMRREGRWPAAEWVLKAQWDAQRQIPHSKMVILRDIEKHPRNVHYNTVGQLKVGRLFAQAFFNSSLRIGGHAPRQILAMLGAKGRDAVKKSQLMTYGRIFGFIDANRDGKLSKKEFIDDGRYLTRRARQGIFRASDSNRDGVVSKNEYIDNRIITDEAKAIFEKMDANDDGKLTRKEFIASGKIKGKELTKEVFKALDSDGNGKLVVPEYLRVWGRWARSGRKTRAAVSK